MDAASTYEEERHPIAQSTLAPNVAFVRRPPRNYKIGAWLSAVFCFFPIGILTVYFSRKVTRSYQVGDLSAATSASEKTKLLIQVSVVIGALCWFGGLLAIIYVSSVSPH